MVSVNGVFRIHVKRKIDNGSALEGKDCKHEYISC